MSISGFRTNSNKKAHPIHQASGVTESELAGYSLKKGVTAPERRFSRATPSSELAHAKTQTGYLKSLNKRLELLMDSEKRNEENSGKKARKEEVERIKEERRKESDKNLQLASQFFDYAKAIQKGQNPEPVNVTVNIDDKKTLPKNFSDEEKKKNESNKEAERKREENIINKVNNPEKIERPSPAMAGPVKKAPKNALGMGYDDVQPSSQHTEEAYAYAASPAYTTGGKIPKKPKSQSRAPIQNSGLTLSEEALMRYPAKG